MRVGQLSLIIEPGKELEQGHVIMTHGQQYKITLINSYQDRAADVELTIDGKSAGKYRLDANRKISLECTDKDPGKFTFFKSDSAEGSAVGAENIAKDDRGLIKAYFVPEKKVVRSEPVVKPIEVAEKTCGFTSDDRPLSYGETLRLRTRGGGPCGQSVTSGVTGLTGRSSDKFIAVKALDYDYSLATTIYLRLVGDDNTPRPLVAHDKSNLIPSAVS